MEEIAYYVDGIQEIINRGGPEISEYSFLKEVPNEMLDLPLEEQYKVHTILSPLFTTDSMIGFTFQKPHGYAGDFELIDRIYNKRKSKNSNLYKWDAFYHKLEASIAVRNRKKYFNNLMNLTKYKFRNPCVLNLGSGPCSDLYEYLNNNSHQNIQLECLDMDKAAIDFGSVVCDNYIDKIKFINKNAFRFRPDYQYELIWSAGLFDYFSDKLFVRLLNRMYALLKQGGELVIGNFSDNNPSKAVMEIFGQWYLYHRGEEQLIELAQTAGIPKKLIKVSQEEEGVNLFLHIMKI